jgi:hypothetical protein
MLKTRRQQKMGPWADPAIIRWSELLMNSFERWLGRDLIERRGSPLEQAQALFLAPFVVVSHGTEADPVLNYGNKAALELWGVDWAQFTKTPSRLTAEPATQPERAQMLARVRAQGFIEDYEGIRVSGCGRRFLIQGGIVWTVVGAEGQLVGQAATFARWTFL